jgi:hypothetical protein
MVAIPVTFYRKPQVVITFDHDVNSMSPYANLRVQGITALSQFIEHLAFEI